MHMHEKEKLMTVICSHVEVEQSILQGGGAEMREPSALLIFKAGQVASIMDFHGDAELSSIRQIRLSVPMCTCFSAAYHVLSAA